MDIDDGLAPGGGQFQRQICRSETFCSQYLHGDHSRVHRCYALPAPIMRTMTMLHLLRLVSGLRAVRSMMMTSCIAGQKLSLAAMSEFYKPRISQAKGVPVLYSTWGIVRICFLPVLDCNPRRPRKHACVPWRPVSRSVARTCFVFSRTLTRACTIPCATCLTPKADIAVTNQMLHAAAMERFSV